LLFAIVLGSLAVAPMRAMAKPTAAEMESARALFNKGMDLRDKGDLAAALKRLKAAHSLGQTPVTGYELGRTYVMLGKLLEAREVLLSVADLPGAGNEPDVRAKARADAVRLAEQLRARVPSITLKVSGAAGAKLALSVDGVKLPSDSIGLEHEVDPGKHNVMASVVGRPDRRAEAKVTVHEGESKTVQLELPPAEATAATPPTPAPTPARPVGPTPPTVDTGAKPDHTLSYVGLGTFGVGLVVGSVTGVMALSKGSSVKNACNTATKVCPPTEKSKLDATKNLATVSTVGFGVAGAGAVITIIGLASEGGKKPRPAARHVAPVIGLGYVGLDGVF
jgi:hypothetical protein